jgi:hypothetical protein
MYVTPSEEEIFKVLQYPCHVHRHAPTPPMRSPPNNRTEVQPGPAEAGTGDERVAAAGV